MSTNLDQYLFGLYNSGTYSPANETITGVSLASAAVITTETDHSFVIGNQVQFLIPREWGIEQLNKLKAFVTDIPQTDQITVDIDTRSFNAFITPTPAPFVVIDNPQVASIGDSNFGSSSPGGVVTLPHTVQGAFINQFP